MRRRPIQSVTGAAAVAALLTSSCGEVLGVDEYGVVGVLPPATAVPAPGAELWQPVGEIDDPYGRFSRQERDFQIVGRQLVVAVGGAIRDLPVVTPAA